MGAGPSVMYATHALDAAEEFGLAAPAGQKSQLAQSAG
jgi:hypothetical protein